MNLNMESQWNEFALEVAAILSPNWTLLGSTFDVWLRFSFLLLTQFGFCLCSLPTDFPGLAYFILSRLFLL